MQPLAGRRLGEMADVRLLRKKRTMIALSVIVFVLLILFGTINLRTGDSAQALIHFSCATIVTGNLIAFLAISKYGIASHVLCIVLFTHAVVLILTGGTTSTSLHWIYPILATIIFVSNQRTGMGITACFMLFCTVVLNMPNFPYLYADYSEFSNTRFLASLGAFLVICHFFSYQHAKTHRYVLALYQEGIEDLAYRDNLTGLANRWSFERWCTRKLVDLNDNRNITAVVFIDNFKQINDIYGHSTGDKLLQSFGKRLANQLRTKNRKDNRDEFSIARYAGDEFVIFLYDVPNTVALDNIMSRILSLFKDGYKVGEEVNHISLSIGVSIYKQDADDLSELLRCADKAMYSAKCAGKNNYEYYHNSHPDAKISSTSLETSNQHNVTPFRKRK
ncbi:GGDEF domain-containing protein [Vibrio tapetis]|uniref:Putative GGDEF family protein n=1 Tax=Vibrio tapetis subsp. tapetis TaxID=1671868 RepID=A0A2N8ZKQ4_9VIBR|nr:GGDEF domain-containing protein [Vibrio tapetis]SON52474.1 putative GGDEF family protein [Vibrio tapetis subsp. tapetis]